VGLKDDGDSLGRSRLRSPLEAERHFIRTFGETHRLTSDQEAALSRAVNDLPCAPHARSLRFLSRSWERLSREVESGYDDSIYEYLNDIGSRDVLQVLISSLPESLSQPVAASIEASDDRFLASTIPVPSGKYLGAGIIHIDAPPPIDSVPGGPSKWWYTRVPARPGEQLRKDLASSGLL
jgi:hypothetical protein